MQRFLFLNFNFCAKATSQLLSAFKLFFLCYRLCLFHCLVLFCFFLFGSERLHFFTAKNNLNQCSISFSLRQLDITQPPILFDKLFTRFKRQLRSLFLKWKFMSNRCNIQNIDKHSFFFLYFRPCVRFFITCRLIQRIKDWSKKALLAISSMSL